MACDARDGSLRYRQKGTNGVHQPPWNGVLQDGVSYVTTQANGQRQPQSRHEKRLLGETFYACLLAFYLATTLLVRSLQVSLPDAVSSDPADEGRVFVGARAKQRLAKLVAIGQRSVGSLENEVIAVDYLMRELEQLRERARPAHRLEFEVQKPNGSFFLDFIDGFTSSYRGIQNVIARLSPRDRPAVDQRHSLLVNCHYDTAPGSPGASDDSIGCAIMLEILHVLSRRREPLPHPVIFLFNGAEENILQGSHGFITQHKWAKEVAAFVNLEACGAGGKELLFQASPSDPWLVKAYVDGATRPFGSIVAEEVFQSGLIPSDTDFRIFRDFGGIPGLDFAFAENGYVYHTKYDNMDYIPDGSIQHAGDNMLGLVLKILEARELNEGSSSLGGTGDTDVIRAVYYDFLGVFMVTYSVSVSSIVVKLIIVISLVSMALRMKASATGGREFHRHELALQVWGRIQALLVTVCSWGLGLVACVLVALTLTVTGSTMSWYKQPVLVLGLYYSTMIATLMACHWGLTMLRRRHLKSSTTGLKVLGESEECDDWNVLERYMDATQLLWLTLVFWLSSKNILSYYIPNLWAVFTGTVVSVLSHWTLGMGRKGHKKALMVAILGAVFLPLLLTVYLCFNIHMGIMPIMGRNGTLENPEIAVAIMSGVLAIACTSFVVPLTHVSRDGWKPVAVLSGLVVLSMLIAMSSFGFPFSATPGDVAPQRMLLFNVERKFYDKHQSMVKQDAGVWAVPLDFNGPRTIWQHIGTKHHIKKVDCSEHVYCGMPYYFPVISKLKETYYADFPGPIFDKGRTFRLLSKNVTKANTIRLGFEFTGPSHMGLIMSPWEGVSLTQWSFTSGIPYRGIKWKNNRDATFVYLSQGVDMGPWNFWIELQVPHDYPASESVVDIAFHTYHLQKSEHKQPAFVKFLNELPEWIHATAWTSSSDFFVF